MIIAISAYNCKSTSLLLVKGGSSSSIGAGALLPLSPKWAHNVRLIRVKEAWSDVESFVLFARAFWRGV